MSSRQRSRLAKSHQLLETGLNVLESCEDEEEEENGQENLNKNGKKWSFNDESDSSSSSEDEAEIIVEATSQKWKQQKSRLNLKETKKESAPDKILSNFSLSHELQSIFSQGYFYVDAIDLDIDVIMKKRFGTLSREENQGTKTPKRKPKIFLATKKNQSYLFGHPKEEWRKLPPFISGGLGMKTVPISQVHSTLPCQTFFCFERSSEYHEIQSQFEAIKDTGDANLLILFLTLHPSHPEALLQLALFFSQYGLMDRASDLLRRSLFSFENCFVDAFQISKGMCRMLFPSHSYSPPLIPLSPNILPYDLSILASPENLVFGRTLFRHMNWACMAGCPQTSAAIAQILLSFSFEYFPIFPSSPTPSTSSTPESPNISSSLSSPPPHPPPPLLFGSVHFLPSIHSDPFHVLLILDHFLLLAGQGDRIWMLMGGAPRIRRRKNERRRKDKEVGEEVVNQGQQKRNDNKPESKKGIKNQMKEKEKEKMVENEVENEGIQRNNEVDEMGWYERLMFRVENEMEEEVERERKGRTKILPERGSLSQTEMNRNEGDEGSPQEIANEFLYSSPLLLSPQLSPTTTSTPSSPPSPSPPLPSSSPPLSLHDLLNWTYSLPLSFFMLYEKKITNLKYSSSSLPSPSSPSSSSSSFLPPSQLTPLQLLRCADHLLDHAILKFPFVLPRLLRDGGVGGKNWNDVFQHQLFREIEEKLPSSSPLLLILSIYSLRNNKLWTRGAVGGGGFTGGVGVGVGGSEGGPEGVIDWVWRAINRVLSSLPSPPLISTSYFPTLTSSSSSTTTASPSTYFNSIPFTIPLNPFPSHASPSPSPSPFDSYENYYLNFLSLNPFFHCPPLSTTVEIEDFQESIPRLPLDSLPLYPPFSNPDILNPIHSPGLLNPHQAQQRLKEVVRSYQLKYPPHLNSHTPSTPLTANLQPTTDAQLLIDGNIAQPPLPPPSHTTTTINLKNLNKFKSKLRSMLFDMIDEIELEASRDQMSTERGGGGGGGGGGEDGSSSRTKTRALQREAKKLRKKVERMRANRRGRGGDDQNQDWLEGEGGGERGDEEVNWRVLMEQMEFEEDQQRLFDLQEQQQQQQQQQQMHNQVDGVDGGEGEGEGGEDVGGEGEGELFGLDFGFRKYNERQEMRKQRIQALQRLMQRIENEKEWELEGTHTSQSVDSSRLRPTFQQIKIADLITHMQEMNLPVSEEEVLQQLLLTLTLDGKGLVPLAEGNLDPSLPLVQLFLQSILPWNRLQSMPGEWAQEENGSEWESDYGEENDEHNRK